MATLSWSSDEVEKMREFLTGMVVFLSISLLIT
jgi:hypothetical protein